MKRLMITCAALALLAGGAHAQDAMQDAMMADPAVTISGKGGFEVNFTGADGANESRIRLLSKFDIGFAAVGTTDQGLTFGASATIEARGGQGQGSATTDAEVHMGGEIWKVTIGDLDPATHMANNLSDIGYDGLGVDDIAEKAAGATGGDAMVTLTFGPASVGVTVNTDDPGEVLASTCQDGSAAPTLVAGECPAGQTARETITALDPTAEQDTHWAIGGKVDIAPVTLAVGYDSEEDVKLSASATIDTITVKGLYARAESDADIKTEGLGAEVGVEIIDGTNLTAVYTQREMDGADDQDAFGVGVTHALGGGATVNAGFAQVNDVNKASVGVAMSF